LSGVIPDMAEEAPKGTWALIAGKAKHRGDYRAAFLYDLSSGRTARIPALAPWKAPTFSADGRTASWLVPSLKGVELYLAKLDSPNPRPVATGITFMAGHVSLSDDGSRVAVVPVMPLHDEGGILTVYDLSTRASLGSVKIPTSR